MNLATALKVAGQAIRKNILPGLLLQSLMIVFLSLYVAHTGTQQFLFQVANLKEESGYLFAFVSYLISAALLPEILRVVFFQRGHVTKRNVWNFLTAAPAWGLFGMAVDYFYRCQIVWFGADDHWKTIFVKVLVDQFLFSPLLAAPAIVGYFAWRDAGFRQKALPGIFNRSFYPARVFPVQVAGWCIWIPGVSLIYFMPASLQIPVAVLIQCFWVMVFTLVNRKQAAS